jgi:hypothetical protein
LQNFGKFVLLPKAELPVPPDAEEPALKADFYDF